MADAIYKYQVCNSKTGEAYEQINLTGVSWSWGLNGSGSFQGTMRLDDPKVIHLQTLSREIVVLRNGVPVFAGPILTLNASLSQKTLTVSAAPVWWYMDNRTMELSLSYEDVDVAVVFDDIMATVNGKFNNDIRLTRKPDYDFTSGQLITVDYPSDKRKMAGQAIAELSETFPGFDWYVHLRLDPTTGACIREYQIYAPFKGVLRDQALTRRNVEEFTSTDDGTRVFNRVHELGAGSDESQLIYSLSQRDSRDYYDDGTSSAGWTTTTAGLGTFAVDNNFGNPSPALGLFAHVGPVGVQAVARRETTFPSRGTPTIYQVGAGTTYEFDLSYQPVNGAFLFFFGCSSTGAGQALHIGRDRDQAGSDTDRDEFHLRATTSWTNTGTITGQDQNLSFNRLFSPAFVKYRIDLTSATTFRLYTITPNFNGGTSTQLVPYKNAAGSFFDDWPLTLSGSWFGIAVQTKDGDDDELVWVDNIRVGRPTVASVPPDPPYVEKVQSRTDVTDLELLSLYAEADLFFGNWPSQTYSAKYQPGATLPFGYCEPGDTVPVDIDFGWLNVDKVLRVVNIPVTVNDGGGEFVELQFNDVRPGA
jgi:hypothetical protein